MAKRKPPSKPRTRATAAAPAETAMAAQETNNAALEAAALPAFTSLAVGYGETLYQRDPASRSAAPIAAGSLQGCLDAACVAGPVEVMVDGIPIWLPGADLPQLLNADGQVKRYSPRAQRGVLGEVLNHVRRLVFGPALNALANYSAAQLCEYLDQGPSVREGSRLGLWQCSAIDLNDTRVEQPLRFSEQPVLILLHGFGSSSAGSFGGLLQGQGRETYANLRSHYGERIYAFDHRTVGHDPLTNAQDLLDLLPVGQTVHLLCYSRGGIVGDLLCCAEGTRWPNGLPRGPEQQAFDQFQEQLAAKRIAVKQMVRVASPLAGTALASDRLDQWLSYMRFALSKLSASMPLLQQTLDTITTLLALVVEQRLDPTKMPGVAAMHPAAPLLAALSAARAGPQCFTVIAGDCVGDGIWRRLKIAITDAFHGTDHDLVVPTASMLAGLRRESPTRYFFAQHPAVDHFHYFHLPDTLRRIEKGLLSDDEPSKDGFQRLQNGAQLQANRAAQLPRKPRPNAPLTVLLPGIMGSVLAARGDTIWVGLDNICLGDFARLRLPDHLLDSPLPKPTSGEVVPEQPLDYWPVNFYGDLIDALKRHGDQVLPFGYDWRRPLSRSAAALAEVLRRDWKPGQPLRFIAHSMGGLVVRLVLAEHADLRQRFVADPRCRVLMLGTPNGGSLAVLNALLGNNDVLQTIDRFAPQNQRQMLEVAATFVGFFELLPQDQVWDEATLRQLLAASGGPNPKLHAKALDLATKGRDALRTALAALPRQQCHYVAGVADPEGENRTLTDVRLVNGRLEFSYGPGDGTVPHASGILDGVDTFYTDALHGDLPRHRKAFASYLRILDGQTQAGADADALKRNVVQVTARSRAVLGQGRDLEASTERPPGLLSRPSAGELYYGLLHRAPSRHDMTALAPELRVQIVHGDIGLARFPILVGHYAGQQLQGAEGRLDGLYQGLLSRNIRLGTYPGAIESFTVFGDDDGNRRRRWRKQGEEGIGNDMPCSAVVVGLGQFGELSVGDLARTVKRGLLAWHGDDAQPGVTPGFSVVLAGVNGSGLSVAECLRGIVWGVLDACDSLRANGMNPPAELDVHEILSDRAHQAAHALRLIADSRDPIGQRVDALAQIKVLRGMDSVGANLPGGLYSRLDVHWSKKHRLRFALPGVQAALPIYHRYTDWRELEYYALQSEAAADGIGEVLFQQLLPRDLKRFALEQYRLVLQLDKRSAALPWELVRSDDHSPPLSISAGMVRQLRGIGYRPLERASEACALVIGDPISVLNPLPGAVQEAELVAQRLEQDGYAVTLLIRPTASDVRRALGARHYRILHFAGHGVVDDRGAEGSDPPRTGLVIGSLPIESRQQQAPSAQTPTTATPLHHLLLLGAEDIAETLLKVPEVIFLNCCYGGQFDLPSTRIQRPALAANVARACIELGARAVVAAGWAVNDDEAQIFAVDFYAGLLKGWAYFDAVREARASIYPGVSNTYGAYQCYGDPDYGLERAEAELKPCVSERELEIELNNIRLRARGAGAAQISALRARVQQLMSANPNLADSSAARTARIYALEELGDYETAVHQVEQWIAAKPRQVPRRLRLWLPILQLRAALRLRSSWKFERPSSRDYLDGDELSLGNIRRRSYLLGRRDADPQQRVADLIEHIQVQLRLQAETGGEDEETAGKAFAATILARIFGERWEDPVPGAERRHAAPTPAMRELVEHPDSLRRLCLSQLQRDQDPDSFWSDCFVPDLKLMLWLDEQFRTVPTHLRWDFGGADVASSILADYRYAFAQSATPKERESVLTFVEIWHAVLCDFAPDSQHLIAPLQQIVEAVRAAG